MNELNSRRPINKTAALVISKSKEVQSYLEKAGKDNIHSMIPLPTRPYNGPDEKNLTGLKFGRFVVTGLALWRPNLTKNRSSLDRNRWVVRCSCGRYQMFKKRTLIDMPKGKGCTFCDKTQYLAGLQKQKP